MEVIDLFKFIQKYHIEYHWEYLYNSNYEVKSSDVIMILI